MILSSVFKHIFARSKLTPIFFFLSSEKMNLQRSVERLETELLDLKVRCEDLWQERQKAVRDLLQLESLQEDEVRHIRAELQDETSSREGMDRRLADLRSEVNMTKNCNTVDLFTSTFLNICVSLQLERLQSENAVEWGKRERLETEKLGLERDNKKLRAELRDVQERLAERRAKPTSASADAELRQCQQELADKSKVKNLQWICMYKLWFNFHHGSPMVFIL